MRRSARMPGTSEFLICALRITVRALWGADKAYSMCFCIVLGVCWSHGIGWRPPCKGWRSIMRAHHGGSGGSPPTCPYGCTDVDLMCFRVCLNGLHEIWCLVRVRVGVSVVRNVKVQDEGRSALWWPRWVAEVCSCRNWYWSGRDLGLYVIFDQKTPKHDVGTQ